MLVPTVHWYGLGPASSLLRLWRAGRGTLIDDSSLAHQTKLGLRHPWAPLEVLLGDGKDSLDSLDGVEGYPHDHIWKRMAVDRPHRQRAKGYGAPLTRVSMDGNWGLEYVILVWQLAGPSVVQDEVFG